MEFNLLGIDDQEARYLLSLSRYLQLFLVDDRGALREQVLRDGAKAWSANKFDFAIFSLARARDWPAIVKVYDVRPPAGRNLCAQLPNFAPYISMALERQGRVAEGARILSCVQRSLTRQLATRFRSPDEAPGELEVWQATLLALRNDRSALDWLDKAVARGWMGQYYSASLTDWPQFDALRGSRDMRRSSGGSTPGLSTSVSKYSHPSSRDCHQPKSWPANDRNGSKAATPPMAGMGESGHPQTH